MVQWNLDSEQTIVAQRPRKPSRRLKTRRTSSRPLVEPEYNSHLLHTGRNNKTITKNGKKLRIRRVVKAPHSSFKQPNFSLE